MREIQLTKGKIALVDDADFEWLNQWKWCVNNKPYAVRRKIFGITISMHRVIMNPPDNMEVDHKDGNKLNNQRSNLRICTQSQNSANMDKSNRNTSGFKGVSKTRGKWRAQIKCNGKKIHIGHFKTPEEAAKAYDEKATELFGEFAKTNFNT